MSTVSVSTATKNYSIIIKENALSELPFFLRKQSYSNKGLLITDDNVAPFYAKRVSDLARKSGIDLKIVIISAGEESKSLEIANKIYMEAIINNLDRKSPIVALGGGVVGDLAGFVAATYMRGVPFIQIPTSLLAQVDSSVGGKVAVNHELGKNLIGAFYQPDIVIIDLNCLQTLPNRELSTGLGEIVKYGLIYDIDFYKFLKNNTSQILNLDLDIIRKIITRCCEIKASVVSEDEKEQGLRAILNFGHTLAHSIETETKYQIYNHGEAVSIGMMAALYISYLRKYISMSDIKDIEKALSKFNLPTRIDNKLSLNADNLFNNMFHDKKTVNGYVKWILLSEIGKYKITKDVKKEEMKSAINFVLEKE